MQLRTERLRNCLIVRIMCMQRILDTSAQVAGGALQAVCQGGGGPHQIEALEGECLP